MERLFKKVFPVLTQGIQYQMHKICYGSYCLDIRKQLNFFRKNWILLSSGFLNLCHRTLLIFSRSICSYIWKAITNNTVLKEIISSTPRLALNSWPSTFSLLNAEVVDMLHAWIAYFLALSVHITLRSGSSCCLTVFQIALNWTEKWDGFANPSGTSQHTQRSEPDTLGEVLCACQAEERACWSLYKTGSALRLNQDWLWLKSELLRWTNVAREQDRWWYLCCSLGSAIVLCVLILRHGPVTQKTHTCKQHLYTWPSFHPPQNATSMQAIFPSEEGWLSSPARVGSRVMLQMLLLQSWALIKQLHTIFFSSLPKVSVICSAIT